MAYADFTFYQNVYKGTIIKTIVDFEPLADDASRRMDIATCFQLESSEFSDNVVVKKCCSAVAEVLARSQAGIGGILEDGRIKAAETVDDHKITYDVSKVLYGNALEDRIQDLIESYLGCIGILRPKYHVKGGMIV